MRVCVSTQQVIILSNLIAACLPGRHRHLYRPVSQASGDDLELQGEQDAYDDQAAARPVCRKQLQAT